MSRYIDAHKLAKVYMAKGKDKLRLATVINELELAPTADVVELRHGEWISVDADVIFKCSICEAEISTSWDYENEDMFAYCPCCGAKMGGASK